MPYTDPKKRAQAARASDARTGRQTIRINADAETAEIFDSVAKLYGGKAAAFRELCKIWRYQGP